MTPSTLHGPLRPHRLAARLAEHPVPPPDAPPMADTASPLLVAFIYHMTRDLIPVRYTESVIAHIRAHPEVGGDPDLMAYAERKARELSYDPTAVGS